MVHNHLFTSYFPRNQENQPPKTEHSSPHYASSHTSAQTTAFLSTQNIDLMHHPPYSPEMAPNDFLLFPYAKNKMRGKRFSTYEEQRRTVNSEWYCTLLNNIFHLCNVISNYNIRTNFSQCTVILQFTSELVPKKGGVKRNDVNRIPYSSYKVVCF